MRLKNTGKWLIYALVVVVSLIAVALVLFAPADWLNPHVVYQGF
jgi:hypothetical protein